MPVERDTRRAVDLPIDHHIGARSVLAQCRDGIAARQVTPEHAVVLALLILLIFFLVQLLQVERVERGDVGREAVAGQEATAGEFPQQVLVCQAPGLDGECAEGGFLGLFLLVKVAQLRLDREILAIPAFQHGFHHLGGFASERGQRHPTIEAGVAQQHAQAAGQLGILLWLEAAELGDELVCLGLALG